MKYGDLNLHKLRDDCGLDFAHYTYKKGQCSCCYGPRDQAAIHWKNRVIRNDGDITYIMYKNADNCSRGRVKKTDEIRDHDCISWKMPMELLPTVCCMLSQQYGPGFRVFQPDTDFLTIIVAKNSYDMTEDSHRDGFLCYYEDGTRYEWQYHDDSRTSK